MSDWLAKSALAKAVWHAGFYYDPKYDIICSRLDAPQRYLGYTWAYDVAAAPLRMIIDCEPFYFSYGDKLWLIEFWKGQYGLETGCEIGVYRDDIGRGLAASNPRTRFFECTRGTDIIQLSFTLYQKSLPLLHPGAAHQRGKIEGLVQRKPDELFSRGPDYHFWLTGFKWGAFAGDTHDLTMDIEMVFPWTAMRDAFKQAAHALGYVTREKDRYSIHLTFDRPRTHQPSSRIALQGTAQARNHDLVTKYSVYKTAKKIASNDPNEFTELDAPTQKVAPLVRRAAAKIQHAAPAGVHKLGEAIASARTLDSNAAAAAARLHGELSNEARSAYDELFAFFDKKVWRTTRQPGELA